MLPSASLPGSGPMARFHANSAPSAPYRPEEVSASIALSTGNSRRTAPSSVRRGCRTGRGTRGPRGIAATPSSRLPASSSLPRRASAEVKKPSASFRTKRPSRNSAIPMGVPTKASPASARSDVTCGSGRPSASAKWSSAPPCQWYTPRSAVPIHKLPTSPASAVTFHPASEGSNGARLLPSQTTTPRPAVPSRSRPGIERQQRRHLARGGIFGKNLAEGLPVEFEQPRAARSDPERGSISRQHTERHSRQFQPRSPPVSHGAAGIVFEQRRGGGDKQVAAEPDGVHESRRRAERLHCRQRPVEGSGFEPQHPRGGDVRRCDLRRADGAPHGRPGISREQRRQCRAARPELPASHKLALSRIEQLTALHVGGHGGPLPNGRGSVVKRSARPGTACPAASG